MTADMMADLERLVWLLVPSWTIRVGPLEMWIIIALAGATCNEIRFWRRYR
jgi:hypothetical protein